jgi:hypothetical protein
MKREIACLKVTPTAGVNDGTYYGTVSLTTGQSYTFSLDIKGESGEPYTIYFANTSGVEQGTSTDFTATGEWERQEVTWACDSTASYRLYVTKNNDNNTSLFYIDGLQCENKAYSTTYVDGNQDGCKWDGAEHASTSERDAQSRLGGRVYNLDTYGFHIDDMPGVGMPPVLHQTQEQPMLPGSLLRGFKTKPRVFDLIANQIGDTHEDLHGKRKDLLNAIKPDLVLEPQPFILRYSGANSEKPVEIRAVYDSGFQFTKLDGFTERDLPLRFIAYEEPYFYEVGDVSTSITTTSDLTVYIFAAKVDSVWDTLNSGVLSGVVTNVLRQGDYLYACGNFASMGGVANANYVARYDLITESWEQLYTTPPDAIIDDMVFDAAGNLYVTGNFTGIDGVSNTTRIAMYDGTNWNALGTGLNGRGYTLLFDAEGNLYVGGTFAAAGGVSDTEAFAKWDGTSWSSVGVLSSGSNVFDIALAKNGNLFIAGDFTSIDADSDLKFIVEFDGTNFSAFGSSLSSGSRAIAINAGGDVFVGGDFTSAGGNTVNKIAKWNGSVWEALGSGLNGEVYSLSFDNDVLYVCGTFTSAGGINVSDRIAIWNGSTWARVDIDLPGTATVQMAKIIDGDLYLGWANATGTATTSYPNAITNNGSRSAYPKIVFERNGGTTATVAWIKNETTDTTLYFDYDLLDGERITIDLSEGDRSIKSSYFGNVWSALLRNSNVVDFNLLPGTNKVSIYINQTGSPTMTAYMQWRNTHWSVDGVAA